MALFVRWLLIASLPVFAGHAWAIDGSNSLVAEPLPDLDSLWDFTDPAASEERFRALVPRTEKAGDPCGLAELLSQIARAQGLQRAFDAAHATLAQAEQLLAEGCARAQVRVLLERGRVLNSSGQPEASAPLFERALDLAADASEEALAVDAAHMLGIVTPQDEQLQWNLRATDMAETSADPKANRWLGSLYNNIGWTYHDRGDYDEALQHFLAAQSWLEEHSDPHRQRIARWTVGRCLRSLDRMDEALAIQRALEAEWAAAGEESGYVFEELGELLLAAGKKIEAANYFSKAYGILSEDIWLQANETERLARLKTLGAWQA